MTAPVRIADAHVHFWDPEHNAYPWMDARPDHGTFLGNPAAFRRTYLTADLLADAAPYAVEKIVHIQAGMAPEDPLLETRWLQALSDGPPDAIVGFAPLHHPDVERLLEEQGRFPNHRGIRHIVSWHPVPYFSRCDRSDYLTDRQWQHGYALLARYGMSFDLQVFPHQLDDAFALGARFPDIPLILDHCAFPIGADSDGMVQWHAGMRRMAELPHCAVKLSGLTLTNPAWTRASLAGMIGETVDLFGPSRAMFASDFPIDRGQISYGQWLGIVELATAGLSPGERDEIFYGTAVRVYRL